MELKSRVTILVKASPQPSKTHSETVCCAGLQEDGSWKRLFPVRFRRLSKDKAFNRWATVNFRYKLPRSDTREESCHVFEDSIEISGRVSKDDEKTALIERALVASEVEAIDRGQSLAVVRPSDVALTWRRLSSSEIESDRKKFADQVNQLSLLEDEIAAYQPCPFKFKLSFVCDGKRYNKTCADWETTATFFNHSKQMEESEVLEYLQRTYCEDYVKKGMVLALGNMKSRPHTWQLLGIFPVKPLTQPDLFGS